MSNLLKSIFEAAIEISSVLFPFFVPVLWKVQKYLRIDEESEVPAYTNGLEIFLNTSKIHTIAEGVKLLFHELLHIVLEHCERIKNLDEIDALLWNIAADCKVNQYLDELNFKLSYREITPFTIAQLIGKSVYEIKRMSTEEIYKELLSKVKSGKIRIDRILNIIKGSDLYPRKDLGDESSGAGGEEKKYPSEGSGAGGEEKKYPSEGSGVRDEEKEKIRDEFRRALVLAKTAGYLPAGLEELVDILFKSKVNWKRLLRTYYREWISSFCIPTWKRPSRKVPDAKGRLYLEKGRVFVLLDTSGSIDKKQLQQFMGEIKSMSKEAEVYWGCWDVKFYGFKRFTNKVSFKIKGRGGTDPTEALAEVSKRIKAQDMLVILTDGLWRGEEWKKYLNLKAKRKILLTTDEKPFKRNDWLILKIDL